MSCLRFILALLLCLAAARVPAAQFIVSTSFPSHAQCPNQVQLRWSYGQSCTVEFTTNLTPPHDWTTVTNAPSFNNGQFTLTLPATEAQKFFRLRCP